MWGTNLMHWFWRATIAVVAYDILALVFIFIITPALNEAFVFYVFSWVVLPFIMVAVYGLLTRYYHPKRLFLDGETRCRKCGYILKGIKEPICSECGEKI